MDCVFIAWIIHIKIETKNRLVKKKNISFLLISRQNRDKSIHFIYTVIQIIVIFIVFFSHGKTACDAIKLLRNDVHSLRIILYTVIFQRSYNHT